MRIKVAVGEGGMDDDQRDTDTSNRECLPTVPKIGTCGEAVFGFEVSK